jgi:hypothetical protein
MATEENLRLDRAAVKSIVDCGVVSITLGVIAAVEAEASDILATMLT